MPLLINKLPQAIAEVMSGINEGLEQAANYVDVVRPPEKVVFASEAIVKLNSIERMQTVVKEPTVRTITATNIVETVSINGNQTGIIPPPQIGTITSVETTTGGGVTRKTAEDQSIGFVFEYPGPKST